MTIFDYQFIAQNVHFAIYLAVALSAFSAFWLYFDAWLIRRAKHEIWKWLGFFCMTAAFVLRAAVVEQPILVNSAWQTGADTVSLWLVLAAYVLIAIGVLLDPLQERPKVESIKKNFAATGIGVAPLVGIPLAALTIAGLYLRRATIGLERHIMPMAWAFGILAGGHILGMARLWRDSSNVFINMLTAPFGPLWVAEHVFYLAAALIMGRWVLQYLTKRFQSQLFMVFTGATMTIFLITTILFTFLLMDNIKTAAANNLETATGVLGYAISGKKSELQATAEAVASQASVLNAIKAKDHAGLVKLTSGILPEKHITSLVITSDSGQVLSRAEDPDRWSDSISSDPLVRWSSIGQTKSSVVTREGVGAPVVMVVSSVPVREGTQVIGIVQAGVTVGQSFVDGIKDATGLDSAIYAANKLSATTEAGTDGSSRRTGTVQLDRDINDVVLKKGQTHVSSQPLYNRPYLAAYAPLKDVDNVPVGMVFTGMPQSALLQSAGKALELTFIVAIALVILSVVPAYLIARSIARQLDRV